MDAMQAWVGVVRRGAVDTKSMDAWNGAAHVLELPGGGRLVLRSSTDVSEADLESAVDLPVEVLGEILPDEAVDPDEMSYMQVPVMSRSLGEDGEERVPVPRAGGVRVHRLIIRD